MKRNDTTGAREYASDTNNSIQDIDANWWRFFSGYRLKQWQGELRNLTEQTGVSLEQVCDYLGVSYKRDILFFARLPKKRSTYIGIGMALGRSVETINRWIGKYGKKRRLYVKDISEDLIWIYLINASARDGASGRNYYQLFDRCAEATYETYCRLWADYIAHETETAQLLQELEEVPFDEEFAGLQNFVSEHMDAFKTAYAKPRQMQAQYVEMLLDHMPGSAESGRQPLNALRGYLDDSMINYLSGDVKTIHAMRRREGRHAVSLKHVPKGRKTHISLALALGMTREEVDAYLQLMGFTALDAVDQEEGVLIHALQNWEEAHPLQRRMKQRCIEGDTSVQMTEEEMQLAVREMLLMRQDLQAAFAREGIESPYVSG